MIVGTGTLAKSGSFASKKTSFLSGVLRMPSNVGGVDICVPFKMKDKFAHINLKKGCQTLDGKNALGFVRARHSDPRGDIGRAEVRLATVVQALAMIEAAIR